MNIVNIRCLAAVIPTMLIVLCGGGCKLLTDTKTAIEANTRTIEESTATMREQAVPLADNIEAIRASTANVTSNSEIISSNSDAIVVSHEVIRANTIAVEASGVLIKANTDAIGALDTKLNELAAAAGPLLNETAAEDVRALIAIAADSVTAHDVNAILALTESLPTLIEHLESLDSRVDRLQDALDPLLTDDATQQLRVILDFVADVATAEDVETIRATARHLALLISEVAADLPLEGGAVEKTIGDVGALPRELEQTRASLDVVSGILGTTQVLIMIGGGAAAMGFLIGIMVLLHHHRSAKKTNDRLVQELTALREVLEEMRTERSRLA